ncbi:MAG: hypothetical protein ACK5S3_03310 [Pirellulaceae bacterium]
MIRRSLRQSDRSGLILLIVLGMLALFSLLATTFLVLSSQSRSASVAIATVKLRQPDPRAISDLVVQQLVRDTNDTRSAFFGHSLLADVYGPNPIRTTARQVPKVLGKDANDQAFLWIAMNNPGNNTLAVGRDAYNGRLVTFLAGPLKGNSFRILDYIGEFNNAALAYSIVIDLSTHQGGMLTGDILSGTVAVSVTKPIRSWLADHPLHLVQDAQGIAYPMLINDAAFNGVGYGLNLSNGSQDVGETISIGGNNVTIPMGLFHSYRDTAAWKLGNTNEGYDVPDYRDYFLHYRALGGGSQSPSQRQIPSFHRPDLINYLTALYGNPTSMTPAQVRQLIELLDFAMARPLAINITGPSFPTPSPRLVRNPYFTGRPPNASGQVPILELNLDQWGQAPAYLEEKKLQAYVHQLINGEWDVDNDGDGANESVWIDPSLPLVPAPDGRMLKVLVAPMIVDLDNRLNLNTAGDLAQADANYVVPVSNSFTQFLETNPAARVLSQGFGYGPADISISHMLPPGNFQAGQTPFHLRGGPDSVPGLGQTSFNPDGNDLLSRFYEREFSAEHYHGPGGTRPSAGLPLARRGGFALGVDRNGNPLVLQNQFSGSVPDEQKNDPYESAPMKDSGSDRLFSLIELEKILRRDDATEAQLPDRLREVLDLAAAGNVNRIVTTRSAELRYANIGTPSGINSPFGASLLGWLHTLYQERLTAQNNTRFPAVPNTLVGRQRFASLFPADFRQGLRMNPNQPFGNGRDDNGNGLIDEPVELENVAQQESFPVVQSNGPVAVNSVTGVYGTSIGNEPARLASRQLLARQIYCLAYMLTPLDGVDMPGVPAGDARYKQKRARVLAQWAVNIVDFRDGDVAMTRFPYDEDPFDNGSSSNLPFEWEPQPGNVVWGMEFPELQLTESLAFHDKRTKDTDQDNGTQGTRVNAAMNADDDFDQYRLPQGSLFLELYATRTTGSATDQTLPAASPSLYVNDNGQLKLDLGKMAPSSPTFGRQPVWRVGISNVEQPGQSPNELLRNGSVASPSLLYQSSINGDSDGDGINDREGSGLVYNFDNATATSLTFDRMVWFANVDPSAGGNNLPIPNLTGSSDPRRDQYPRIFFSRNNASAYLTGGSYAVVGPRQTTYTGSQNVAASTDHLPSPQRFVLTPTSVETYLLNGNRLGVTATLPSGSAVKPAVGIIAAASRLTGWNVLDNAATGVIGTGLNISEPLPIQGQPYYQLPTQPLDSTDTGGSAGGFSYPGFRDMPIDSWKDFSKTAGKTLPDQPFDEDPARNRVLLDANMQNIGTYANARTAYLQRLADPDFPYDPETNPYITIDWISLDLTVFSGEDDETKAPGKNQTPTFAFQSRYKDGSSANHFSQLQAGIVNTYKATPSHGGMVFSYSTGQLNSRGKYTGAPMAATQTPFFNYLLGDTSLTQATKQSSTSLGYLNIGRPDPTKPNHTTVADYDAYGPPLFIAANNPFNGAPQTVAGSLFWFNRPFASPYELMLVPGVGPGELNQTATTLDRSKLYARQTSDRLRAPFGHLMNFFESSPKGAGESEFYLLMELMETPAPYADAAVVKNPASLQQIHAGGDTDSDLIRSEMLSDYFAPRNFIPSMVNPGKVNINTIPGEQMWKGVELNYLRGSARNNPTTGTNWAQIAASRRGYAPASNPFLVDQHPNLNPAYPTQFAGAFRPGLLGAVGPVLAGEAAKDGSGNLQSTRLRNLVRKSHTLLRPDTVPSPDPLPDGATPLMLGGANAQQLGLYRDSDKQPFIAYQRLTRLPNLVTQQSNVYAVWMTVGFFEFDFENSGIGAEFTGNRGEVTRHRSFYIIDRTTPVGFRPGEDLNTDKAILLRRFIE